jgi:hypothetical protein
MALTHVQTTAKHTSNQSGTFTITFATLPTIGNALLVCINKWGAFESSLTCTDNQGHAAYAQVVRASNTSGVNEAVIFLCPLVATSAGTFTITISSLTGGPFWVGAAIEVGGLGGGSLATDTTVSATGSSAAPATGSTAALTASEVFVVVQHAVSAAQSAITVAAVSPPWTEVFEELPYDRIAGEADRRILTSASGTTTSGSWTNSVSGPWSAVLAAFATTAVVTTAQLSQAPLEVLVLSDQPVALRVSQAPLEVLHSSSAAPILAQLSQLPIEVLLLVPVGPVDARLSQLPLEVLRETLPSEDVSATQLSLELAARQASVLTVTQAPLEIAHQQLDSAIDTTQAVIELARDKRGHPGVASVSQVLIEIIRRLIPEVRLSQIPLEILVAPLAVPIEPIDIRRPVSGPKIHYYGYAVRRPADEVEVTDADS